MKDWSSLPLYKQTAEILKVHRDPVHFASGYFLPSLSHIIVKEKAKIVREFCHNNYTELVLIGGMRSGKSELLRFFGLLDTFYVLTIDYVKKYKLASGTPLFGLLCSSKEETAIDTLFNPMCSYMEESPFFREQICEKYKKVLTFPERNFTIKPIAASAATEVGRTTKFVCIDEFSKIQETESLRGAKEIYRAITKSTATLKQDGHRYIAGSLRSPFDVLVEAYRIGKQIPTTLALKYSTWELNPTITREDLESEFRKDPLGALRDYGSEVYSIENAYFGNPDVIKFDQDSPNLLEKINEGLHVKGSSFPYVLAGDPAFKHDAFGLALSHKEGDEYICDGAIRLKHGKEVSPHEVKRVIMSAIEQLPIRWAVFDTWNFPETIEEIRRKGVVVLNHVVKKEDYDFFKDKCYEKKAKCPSYSPLEIEFKSLLIRGNKVDHPRGGSKDVADAVVNSFWVLKEKEEVPQYDLIERF